MKPVTKESESHESVQSGRDDIEQLNSTIAELRALLQSARGHVDHTINHANTLAADVTLDKYSRNVVLGVAKDAGMLIAAIDEVLK